MLKLEPKDEPVMIVKTRRIAFLLATSAAFLAAPTPGRADIVVSGGFGPNGDVGFLSSPPTLSITFGDGQGSISQMDGFVNVPGRDFGAGSGQSADLANGAPTGLTYSFQATQPTTSQLLLTYNFVNNTGATLSGFQFLYFVDPDIGPNFADEHATVFGSNSLIFPNATSYQVGDPSLSTLFTNLNNGTLSNVNELPGSNPGDVGVGLGFQLGALGIGKSASFQILLSDNGTHLGNVYITHQDPAFTNNSLTISGIAVPEPSSWISLTIGAGFCLAYARTRLSSKSIRV